ncbi:MAG: S1 RNA-binding domain-containing protein [Erysipelotrichaceae bacterium]|jgi:predicted RNA-binding protein with RPS1 domain|nr:S1 RNA-binding domain-containing protein [Erysipelotrichaceae bacterium]
MSYQIGDVVDAVVTGIQPYGAFVALDNNTNGLIHISEISAGFVKDVHMFVEIGDRVTVKIIDIDPQSKQARLSLKALYQNRARQLTKAKLPVNHIGFSTLRKLLPDWLKREKGKK